MCMNKATVKVKTLSILKERDKARIIFMSFHCFGICYMWYKDLNFWYFLWPNVVGFMLAIIYSAIINGRVKNRQILKLHINTKDDLIVGWSITVLICNLFLMQVAWETEHSLLPMLMVFILVQYLTLHMFKVVELD